MSIYHESQPAAQDEFRKTTAASNMIGVTRATFKCRKCRKAKFMQGRKAVNKGFPRDGYVCADCACLSTGKDAA